MGDNILRFPYSIVCNGVSQLSNSCETIPVPIPVLDHWIAELNQLEQDLIKHYNHLDDDDDPQQQHSPK